MQKNILPVFLGKSHLDLNEDYDLSEGVDFIGRTLLFDALRIIDCAEMVIGIDNGLLHLAACTKTPIVWDLQCLR